MFRQPLPGRLALPLGFGLFLGFSRLERWTLAHGLEVIEGRMTLEIPGKIQDQAIHFRRGLARPTAQHLHDEGFALRRAQQHHAVNVRDVKAGRGHFTVHQGLELASTKPL